MALAPDSVEFTRLILQIERELLALAQLKSLATDADTIADDRPEQPRALRSRLRRFSTTSGRFAVDC